MEQHPLKNAQTWLVIFAILGAAMTIGAAKMRLSDNSKALDDHAQELRAQNDRITRLESAVAAIPDMQKDIKDILREVKSM